MTVGARVRKQLRRGIGSTDRLWKPRLMPPLLGLAPRGMSPEAIALSVALGFALGLFPVPGCPTLLCALAALVLRLKGPAVQAVNYLVYPLQLALLAPFMRLGGRLFHAPAGRASALHLPAILHGGAWRAVPGVLAAAAHAIAGWLCIGGPAGLLIYLLLAYCLRRPLKSSDGRPACRHAGGGVREEGQARHPAALPA